jgi:hypothetical protein
MELAIDIRNITQPSTAIDRWCRIFFDNAVQLLWTALVVSSSGQLAEGAVLAAFDWVKEIDIDELPPSLENARAYVVRCSIALTRWAAQFEGPKEGSPSLGSLPVELRLAFILRLVLRLSEADAANSLHLTRRQVSQRVIRASRLLAKSRLDYEEIVVDEVRGPMKLARVIPITVGRSVN